MFKNVHKLKIPPVDHVNLKHYRVSSTLEFDLPQGKPGNLREFFKWSSF